MPTCGSVEGWQELVCYVDGLGLEQGVASQREDGEKASQVSDVGLKYWESEQLAGSGSGSRSRRSGRRKRKQELPDTSPDI